MSEQRLSAATIPAHDGSTTVVIFFDGDTEVGQANYNTLSKHLDWIEVQPPFRGQGYGTEMVAYLITHHGVRSGTPGTDEGKSLLLKFGDWQDELTVGF